MTIAQALAAAKIDQLDAEVLLAHILCCERVKLISDSNSEVGERQQTEFEKLTARRVVGEPVAHLIGSKEFYGLEFAVNSKVLIPRPETEQIVEEVLKLDKEISLLDVGTGSGCIAVAIAKHSLGVKVSACDISLEALEIARKNAQQHNVEIEFYESDLLESVPHEYDTVVANLPYIADSDSTLESEVKQHEPHLALFAGETGLELYERLLQQISQWQERPQLLLAEIGWQQCEAMTQLIEKYLPSSKVECLKDLAGHDRIIKIQN